MRIQNKKNLASILLVLISFVCEAQTDGIPPPPAPPPPVGVPIDDYLFMLFFLALVYGIVRRLKCSRK